MDYSRNSEIFSEIVVGIVGPIGCNRELVITTIENLAKHFSYETIVIKVSDIIRAYEKVEIDEDDQYSRVMNLMDAGNMLRVNAGDNSVLAKMTAIEISRRRGKVIVPKSFILLIH